jgi:hypothetical protein
MADTFEQLGWIDRCNIARVRMLALREVVAAGGPVSGSDLRRVLEPIIGDLLPPAGDELEGGSARSSDWWWQGQAKQRRGKARAVRVVRKW